MLPTLHTSTLLTTRNLALNKQFTIDDAETGKRKTERKMKKRRNDVKRNGVIEKYWEYRRGTEK
jgi:hypothetical protein